MSQEMITTLAQKIAQTILKQPNRSIQADILNPDGSDLQRTREIAKAGSLRHQEILIGRMRTLHG